MKGCKYEKMHNRTVFKNHYIFDLCGFLHSADRYLFLYSIPLSPGITGGKAALSGRGLHLKKLPLLKVDVGKVCKTCVGSGYLPR